MSGVSVEPASPHDLAAIEALLSANQLPTAGLGDSLGTALVARVGSRTIGSVALEVYPSGVLLRSVAVDNAWRGRGIGQQLTSAGLDLARSLGAGAAYLLTTIAFLSAVWFCTDRARRSARGCQTVDRVQVRLPFERSSDARGSQRTY
jgi:N-acetylglutamate synthase-like GNAT family acetyltransferase